MTCGSQNRRRSRTCTSSAAAWHQPDQRHPRVQSYVQGCIDMSEMAPCLYRSPPILTYLLRREVPRGLVSTIRSTAITGYKSHMTATLATCLRGITTFVSTQVSGFPQHLPRKSQIANRAADSSRLWDAAAPPITRPVLTHQQPALTVEAGLPCPRAPRLPSTT